MGADRESTPNCDEGNEVRVRGRFDLDSHQSRQCDRRRYDRRNASSSDDTDNVRSILCFDCIECGGSARPSKGTPLRAAERSGVIILQGISQRTLYGESASPQDMRVDLRRTNVGMFELLLHRTYIHTTFKQVSCK